MKTISTVTMSPSGRITIPEDVRRRLSLKGGTQFVVMDHGDTALLKTLSEPSWDEFERLLAENRRRARESGMRRSDIDRAVAKAHRHK